MREIRIGIVICVMGMYSCKTEFAEPKDAGYSFYQIEQGHYIAYDVDSIVFDIPSGIQDTFHFQVKEYIDSTFIDLEGRPTARIKRSHRNTSADPWVLKNIWVANRTQTTAEKVEENVRFIRMSFPVNAEVEWDGNVQNTFSTWNYHYEDIDAMMNIGTLSFPRTVTVNQRNVSNLIQREFAEEIYAYEVGMVYKQLDTLKYTLSGGIQTLRTGIKFKMTAFEYGEE